MSYGLDLETLSVFRLGSYRLFAPHEKHITRICRDDVLLLMLGGSLSFKEDGVTVTLMEGEYYIQRSGLLQESNGLCGGAYYYYIHFHGTFSEAERSLPLRGRFEADALMPYLKRLEAVKERRATAIEKNAPFYSILSALLVEKEPSREEKTVLFVKRLVEKDLSRGYTLNELANACSYSKNNLIRIFKEQTGMPPLSYLTSLRLQKAKELLEHTETDVGQVAHLCGFGNYINFYKHFKNAEGCAPGTWRGRRRGT